MLDGQRFSDRSSRLRWPVLAVAVLSLVFWAASYSWLLGLTPPTRWLSAASPWLIMEVAAVITGAAALVAGVLLAREPGSRRAGALAAWLGGFALLATTASLLA